LKINLVLWADRIEGVTTKTAVVIDVLRASSTIVTSLSNGAQEIIPELSIAAANDKAQELTSSVIAGERDGVKVDGFDLGNSPIAHQRDIVENKKVILTTTNGTKCFRRLEDASEVIVASLLNLKEVIKYLKTKEQILLCCAGNYGDFAIDDFIVAGKIIAKLKSQVGVEVTDKGQAAYDLYKKHEDDLLSLLLNSDSGQNLMELGYKEDIKYIVHGAEQEILPVYKDGRIVASRAADLK